jgi:hypothetical protein
MVEVESRCDREESRLGRGDFLVVDGERLWLFLVVSSGLDVFGVLGGSGSVIFSEGLGPIQANLMVLGRFGASVVGATVAVDSGAVGASGFGTGSLRAPHAKVMQRFLGATSAGDWVFGDVLMSSATMGSLFVLFVPGSTGSIDLATSENGAKLVNVSVGKGGLGVLVREGLVCPPSLVSSAVDAELALLFIDRRRDNSVVICTSGFFKTSGSGVFRALVSRDSFRCS